MSRNGARKAGAKPAQKLSAKTKSKRRIMRAASPVSLKGSSWYEAAAAKLSIAKNPVRGHDARRE